MAQLADAWLERQQRRFTRYDAHRWMRPDAQRWLRPDAERWVRPEWRKANFDPNQPRVAAGSPEGGQWTGDGQNGPENGDVPVHAASDNRPPPRGAAVRFAVRMALNLIGNYRRENNLKDLFGNERGTVAFTRLDDKWVFGTNSDVKEYSTAYTDRDYAAATELRDSMLWKHSDVMNLENVGQAPNDAVYHAETTVLMRTWELNGGTLEGRELTLFVDGKMCPSCAILLPRIGMELGNPTVRFIDRWGRTRTMKDGQWKE